MDQQVYVGVRELAVFALGVVAAAVGLYKFFAPRDKCEERHKDCHNTATELQIIKNKMGKEREEFIEVRTFLLTMKDEVRSISSKLDKLLDNKLQRAEGERE